MLDKTIDSALINLRKQIIQRRLDGLEHVNALLGARGIDPDKLRIGAKRKPDFSRKGLMRVLIMGTLRNGPMRSCEIAAVVAARRPEIGHEAARKRTAQALDRMQLAGLVKREGRLWGLAQ